MTSKPLTLPAALAPQSQNFVVIQANTHKDLESQLNTLSKSHRIGIISSHIDNGSFFATVALYKLKS